MKRTECNRNCWILASIAGVVVLLFTSGIGDLGFGAGLFLALITAGLSGALLVWLVCHEQPMPVPSLEPMTSREWQQIQMATQQQTLLAGGPLAEQPMLVQMPVLAELPQAQDDLLLIKGVGPKIRDWLVQDGVTRFDQIAAWDGARIAEMAQRMGRMGSRIEADDWVGQAKALAKTDEQGKQV